MFLMVFYDFKIRGGDFAGRSPRLSFYICCGSSFLLVYTDCSSRYPVSEIFYQMF